MLKKNQRKKVTVTNGHNRLQVITTVMVKREQKLRASKTEFCNPTKGVRVLRDVNLPNADFRKIRRVTCTQVILHEMLVT